MGVFRKSSWGLAVVAWVALIAAGFGLPPAHCASSASGKQGDAISANAPFTWAADPTSAGDSLPASGRSLFDVMMAEGKRVDVPFPFEALLRKIESRAGCAARPAGGGECLKAVLIPLGRSLQRTVAAPDFFKYPRVVVAVDREPAPGAAPGFAALAKDRLYLGYQEQAALIEVISYNEQAGRFEFQIVKDYRAGANPTVVYANRAVCIACHQNHAPLFSRQVWDETNANPRIARLLQAHRPAFYGVRVARGVDIPNAIDDATERANLFSVWQKLWREACELGGDKPGAVRCRASVLHALLQYRLGGERGFDRSASSYSREGLAKLNAAVPAKWPGGLALPNPDIPNRDPLAGLAGDPLSASGTLLAHVPAQFEALRARAPLEIWPPAVVNYAERIVAGLSQFLAGEDIGRLDDQLFALGSAAGKPRATFTSACRFVATGTARMRVVDFDCPGGNGEPPGSGLAGPPALRLAGRMRISDQRRVEGSFANVAIQGSGAGTGELSLQGSSARAAGEETVTFPSPRRDGAHVRLIDGNALEHIRLRWRAPPSATGSVESAGHAELGTLQDFAPLETAVAELARDPQTAAELFGAAPFRRSRIMPALYARLGMSGGQQCCTEPADMALPQLDRGDGDAGPVAAGAEPFYQFCALCHRTPETSPPNFLYGRSDAVSANLRHCAERIYYRLTMWQSGAGVQSKTPMPPAYALYGFGSAVELWPRSPHLAELSRRAAELVRGKTGAAPELLLERNYESLPACLAAAPGDSAPRNSRNSRNPSHRTFRPREIAAGSRGQ